MQQATEQALTSRHIHAIRFYENRSALARLATDFLGAGLVAGQPVLIISTPEHCDAIVRELRGRHFDIDALQAAGDLLLMDARATLSMIMVDGHPDGARFDTEMGRVLDHIRRGRKDCTIHAYGELVDLLWKDDLTVAAIQLEMFWNTLAATHKFSLLCGYAIGQFYSDANVEDICGQHSHVVSAQGVIPSFSSTSRTTVTTPPRAILQP